MQVRRRWCGGAVAVLLATAQVALGQTAPGTSPADVQQFMQAQAQAISSGDDQQAVGAQDRVISGFNALSGKAAAQSQYAKAARDALAPLITASKQSVAINATATLAKIGDISMDRSLEDALASPLPGVRYWAARGLATVMKQLVTYIHSDYVRAENNLAGALAKESDPIVASAICNTLARAGDVQALDAVVKYLDRQGSSFAKNAPTSGNLVAAAEAARAVGALGEHAQPAQKKAAVQAIVNALGLAAQRSGQQPSELAASEYGRMLGKLGDVATDSLNKLGAKTQLHWPNPTGVEQTSRAALEITGIDQRPGTVNRAFDGINPAPKLTAVAAGESGSSS